MASFVGPDGPLSIVVCGAAVSTVKLRDAGVGSTLPAGSVARTSNVWAPSASEAVVSGRACRRPTRRRRRGTRRSSPAWLAENANVGVASFVGPEGPLSIVVCGAAVSTVKLRDAGVGSTLPAGSVARTSNVWAPSASDAVVSGDAHEPQAPPSTRHSNVEPASSAENPNVGVASFVGPDGPLSIVVLRRGRVDREAARRRRRVDVAGRVGRAHLEGVRAVGQRRGGLGRRARTPRRRRRPGTRTSSRPRRPRTRTSAWRRSSGRTGRCRSWSAARRCRP